MVEYYQRFMSARQNLVRLQREFEAAERLAVAELKSGDIGALFRTLSEMDMIFTEMMDSTDTAIDTCRNIRLNFKVDRTLWYSKQIKFRDFKKEMTDYFFDFKKRLDEYLTSKTDSFPA